MKLSAFLVIEHNSRHFTFIALYTASYLIIHSFRKENCVELRCGVIYYLSWLECQRVLRVIVSEERNWGQVPDSHPQAAQERSRHPHKSNYRTQPRSIVDVRARPAEHARVRVANAPVEHLCNIKDDLGQKGKSGVLESMEIRKLFLEDKSSCVHFLYTPKHASWLNQARYFHPKTLIITMLIDMIYL